MQLFKTEEKVIGAYTYKVTQLDAITGRRAFTRMMKVVGPALGGSSEGLETFFSSLAEDDMDHFCNLFAKMTTVSGGDLREGAEPQLSDVFMYHFAGRYLEMVEWLVFAFKVNFASFFAGAGALAAQVRGQASA